MKLEAKLSQFIENLQNVEKFSPSKVLLFTVLQCTVYIATTHGHYFNSQLYSYIAS